MPKHWTEAQLDQFIIAADDLDERSREHIHTRDANPRWCQYAAELLFMTGLRISEAVRLSWGEVRFPVDSPGRLYVTQAKGQTKSRQDRVVPMLARAEALLRRLEAETRQTSREDEPVLKARDGISPISANHTNRRFNRYRKHAGLPAIGLHGLRHSFAFHLLQRGVGIDHVKEFLGHGSLAVTEVYAKMSPEERLRIVHEAMSR